MTLPDSDPSKEGRVSAQDRNAFVDLVQFAIYHLTWGHVFGNLPYQDALDQTDNAVKKRLEQQERKKTTPDS